MTLIRPSAGRAALVVVLVAAACKPAVQTGSPAPAPAPARLAINSGSDVVRAMHDSYAGKWYRNLTFKQVTTIWTPTGGQLVQTWYEAGAIPGRLRIDTDTLGGGVIYARDSIFAFQNGRLARADTGMNPLMVLGFDVYGQDAARSATVLRHLGYDLTKLGEGTWKGRPVWIVGAAPGDTTTAQFWVDKERLVFVRGIEPRGRNLIDFRFDKYVAHGDGWVAEEVWQYVNGKPRVHEEYSNVRVNVPLTDAIWDPKQWGTTRGWWKTGG